MIVYYMMLFQSFLFRFIFPHYAGSEEDSP